MTRQYAATIQTTCSKKEMESEFENLEEIITRAYHMLDEYDLLMKLLKLK